MNSKVKNRDKTNKTKKIKKNNKKSSKNQKTISLQKTKYYNIITMNKIVYKGD